MTDEQKMILLKAYCYDTDSIITDAYISANCAIVLDEDAHNYCLVCFNDKREDWTEINCDEDYNYILEKYNRIICENV